MSVRALVRAVAVGAAGLAVALAASAAPSAAAAPASFPGSSYHCSVPLNYGSLDVYVTPHPRGIYGTPTTIALVPTRDADAVRLVWDRAYNADALYRGITGDVYATRTWTVLAENSAVLASVGVVDLDNGRYGSCNT